MIRKIIQIGDPKLLERSEEVNLKDLDSSEIKKLVKDLYDTLVHHKENAAGLSAVQLGVLKRIFVVKDVRKEDREEYITMINPTVKIKNKKMTMEWEGCMSISSDRIRLFGPVERPKEVEVNYFDLKGEKQIIRAKNFFSHLIQHEIDHLNGKLFLGYVKKPENIWKENDLDKYLKEHNKFPEVV